MDIGLMTNYAFWRTNSFAGHVEDGIAAEQDGFYSFWVEQTPQPSGIDALTCLAMVGARTETVRVGVSVVPTIPRHPVVMAQQALSTQSACGGRLVLGVGPSHAMFMEGMYGLSYEHPARQTEEYLTILRPLLHGEPATFSGDVYQVDLGRPVQLGDDAATEEQRPHAAGPAPPPLVLAAMGPQMLRIAGHLADGIVPGMAGADIIESYFVPAVAKAAAEAGRKTPRVIVGLPVALVAPDRVDAARDLIDSKIGVVRALAPYRRMFEAQDIGGPSSISLVGDEMTIVAGLQRLADAGLDEYVAICVPADDGTARRTQELLGELARRGIGTSS
jgi:5,10-methylenetetrahydromethanopterin reductase